MIPAIILMRFVCVVVLGLAAIAQPASAARIERRGLGDGIELISIEGEIIAGDEEKFRRLSVQYDNAVVALSSEGGALLSALEIGKMIRLKEYPTLVMDNFECASACALIWIAGSTRFLAPKGRVGFHASYRDEGGRKVETGTGNALIGRYLTLLNLPEKAVLFATAAPPDKVLWLSPANMRDSGIDFEIFSQEGEETPPVIRRTNTGSPPLITPAGPDVLAQPSVPDFVIGFKAEKDGNAIVEQVPSGETVQKWTRMITMQRFAGVAGRTDADGFLQLMLDGLERACPGATVAYRRPAGSAAQIRIDCPLNPATRLPETFFAKAVPGAVDMHVAQVAFRRVPSAQDAAWAEDYLAGVTLKP